MTRTNAKKRNSRPKDASSLDFPPLFAAESPAPSAQKAEGASPGPSLATDRDATKNEENEEIPPLIDEILKRHEAEQKEAEAATQAGRGIMLRYYERKRDILAREKDNCDEMIFTKATSNTWWKAFDKSAVYFSQIYAEKIGSKAKLQIDGDYKVKSRIGVVSIPNIEGLVKKLEKIGVKIIKATNQTYIFKMERRVAADEFNLLLENSQTLIEQANKMILPENMMPNLMEDAKMLFVMLYWVFKKMDKFTHEVVGTEITKLVFDVIIEYTVMAKTHGDPKEFLQLARRKIARAEGLFMGLVPLRIVGDKKVFEIAQWLKKTRDQIIFEEKKIAIKEINEKRGGVLK